MVDASMALPGWSSNARTANTRDTFEETGNWEEGHWFAIKREIMTLQTQFQEVRIIDTEEYGKMLILDGHTQSAEDDERLYHESLVHPAMLLHPNPRRVLIIGGGEGATAREVLRHPGVEQVTMVDLDGELIEACRKHLAEWHDGAFDDPRFRLIIGDGLAFLDSSEATWDVIILDLVDAFEEGPSEALFSTAFYRNVKRRLARGGVVAVQAMELSATSLEDHLVVRRNLKPVFRHMVSYSTFVPSFWCEWGYIVASDTHDLAALDVAACDRSIASRGTLAQDLQYIDGETMNRMRSVPLPIRRAFTRGA